MSSHHIVRDEQEPALYIHVADNFLLTAMGDLLEWSPTVIVSDEALQKVVDFGIKVDAVPQFSMTEDLSKIMKSQQPVRVLAFDPNDISGLFRLLEAENYKGLNIATLDLSAEELMAAVGDYQGPMSCTVYTAHKRMICIDLEKFEKWLPEGQYGLKSTGSFSLVEGFDEEIGPDVVGKIELKKSQAGLVRISCTAPPYWFIEEI